MIDSLEVGCRVWPSTRVVILFKVGLEWSAAVGGAARLLITKCRTRASHQIIVVFSDTIFATPDSPAHKGNATEKDSTTHTTDNSTNDFLIVVGKTTIATASAVLWNWCLGGYGGTCGG